MSKDTYISHDHGPAGDTDHVNDTSYPKRWYGSDDIEYSYTECAAGCNITIQEGDYVRESAAGLIHEHCYWRRQYMTEQLRTDLLRAKHKSGERLLQEYMDIAYSYREAYRKYKHERNKARRQVRGLSRLLAKRNHQLSEYRMRVHWLARLASRFMAITGRRAFETDEARRYARRYFNVLLYIFTIVDEYAGDLSVRDQLVVIESVLLNELAGFLDIEAGSLPADPREAHK